MLAMMNAPPNVLTQLGVIERGPDVEPERRVVNISDLERLISFTTIKSWK